MDSLSEMLLFLDINARLDLKAVSVNNVLSYYRTLLCNKYLTGTPEGRALIIKSPKIIKNLFELTTDTTEAIAKDALRALVNISADSDGSVALLCEVPNMVDIIIGLVLDEENKLADAWAIVLSNVSRTEDCVEMVVAELLAKENLIDKLVTSFTQLEYNKSKCNLNYLGSIFSNISQSSRGRDLFCKLENDLVVRLLPFICHENLIRRGGIIGLLKNLCFDSKRHDWLLHQVNVLPSILLPLAGPEEFSDEDNDMFPTELQYLDTDKKREEDADLRKMLLESLAQLCATRKARDFLRLKGTYEILRELHKFELTDAGDRFALLACENVVDVLIRTEEEIGEDNLKELDIPNELVDKFEKES